jgi:hypothetical protein
MGGGDIEVASSAIGQCFTLPLDSVCQPIAA